VSSSGFYWAAKAIEDINSKEAAALFRKAIASGCPHSLYALGTLYAKYPPPTSMAAPITNHYRGQLAAGRSEIKRAARAGYAPALYRMYWDYKSVVQDHHPSAAPQATCDHIKGRAFQKSESYLREAEVCDPDGSALMFEIDRFRWGRDFPAAGSQEYRVQWPETLSERYQMAIRLAQGQGLVRVERISAYLDALNAHVHAVTRQGQPVNAVRFEERCRVYYMLGMTCSSLGLTTEAQKNFKLAAGLTMPRERPLPAEYWLALVELSRQ
jgi:hypothetical protein